MITYSWVPCRTVLIVNVFSVLFTEGCKCGKACNETKAREHQFQGWLDKWEYGRQFIWETWFLDWGRFGNTSRRWDIGRPHSGDSDAVEAKVRGFGKLLPWLQRLVRKSSIPSTGGGGGGQGNRRTSYCRAGVRCLFFLTMQCFPILNNAIF